MRAGGGPTHDELLFLFSDNLLVPPRAFPEPLDLGPEPPELFSLVARALLCVAEAVGEGEEALGVGRLDLVLLGEVCARLGELGLERGDEGGAEGGAAVPKWGRRMRVSGSK